MHYTKEEFIRYLEGTLLPDLIEAGTEHTALDFKACLLFMKGSDSVEFNLESMKVKGKKS